MCFFKNLKKKKVAGTVSKNAEVQPEKKNENTKVEPVKEKKTTPVKEKEPKKVEPIVEEDEREYSTKVYHVSKRKEDGLWVVKFATGKKVIKTFATKREAVEYTDVMAKNQEGIVLTHASKGAKQGKIYGKRSTISDEKKEEILEKRREEKENEQ